MQFYGEYSSNPPEYSATVQTPLDNLETVRLRMDSLHQFLIHSVNTNTAINKDRTATISSEITSAINQIIVNGAAIIGQSSTAAVVFPAKRSQLSDHKGVDSDCEIVELDAVEILAEHIHFCEICGKGFKRDANLRMHMRAHGNQFKTPEALAKPDKELTNSGAKRRFSCPFQGCNRNKNHLKFRPLKSVICVKNHFKRTHCPKLYSCNRCNKKSFSVVADLKSHLKNCGAGGRGGEASKWRCSCGTSFSRKDKLFGHVGLFEGHMPAVVVEESEGGKVGELRWSGLESAGFEDRFEGFSSIEGSMLEDVVGLSSYFYGRGPL